MQPKDMSSCSDDTEIQNQPKDVLREINRVFFWLDGKRRPKTKKDQEHIFIECSAFPKNLEDLKAAVLH